MSNSEGLYPPPADTRLAHPIGPQGAVAWYLKPGWLGQARRIASNAEPNDWIQDITLDSASPLLVTVVDSEGLGVPGATVQLSGTFNPRTFHRDLETASLLPLATQASLTDEGGKAVLTLLPGTVEVRAQSEGLVSEPFSGICPDHLTLVLRGSFTVTGTFTPPSDPEAEINPRLRVELRRQGSWKPLITKAITKGNWGPFPIPLPPGAEEYRLIVDGKPMIAEVHGFGPPAVGEEVRFDIEAQLGDRLYLRPIREGTRYDAEPETIMGARARVLTETAAGTHESWIDANENGTILVTGLPTGQVVYYLVAPGYQPSSRRTIAMPLAGEEKTWLEELKPSGTLSGVVLEVNDGTSVPAQDFDVILWPFDELSERFTHPFRGRLDGRFTIESPPAGEISVAVATSTRPSPLPKTVTIVPGERTEIELHVPKGSPITGRALDADTGRPIATAKVQLYIQGQAGPIAPWGATRNVDADGRFRIEGGVPHENFIYITAENYSARYLSAFPDDSGSLVFGDILFQRQSRLTVRVPGLDQRKDLNAAALRISLDGPTRTAVPIERFDDGTWGAVLTAVNAGFYGIDIQSGNDVLRSIETDVPPAADHTVEIPLGGASSLEVTLTGGTEQQRASAIQIMSSFSDEAGNKVYVVERIAKNGPTIIHGLTSDRIRVYILAKDYKTRLGSKEYDLVPGETKAVELPFAERFFEVHVFTPDHSPVSGALVSIYCSSTDQIEYNGLTDSTGTARFTDVPRTPLSISLVHTDVGRQLGISVDGNNDEVDLTLEPTGSLVVTVTDEGAPLAGIDVALLADRVYQVTRNSTDSTGQVTFAKLAPSKGNILIAGADLWEERFPFETRTGTTVKHLAAWRTGSLAITVTDSNGIPLPGVHLTLTHTSTGKDLAAWVAAQRISAGSETSNADGALLIQDIPHGSYHWTLSLRGYETTSGQTEVPIGTRGNLSVHMTADS